MGMGCQRHAPAALPPGKDSVPILQEAGWAPGPLCTGTENLNPHRDSIPGPPARSESLYQLRYPGSSHHVQYVGYFQPFVPNVHLTTWFLLRLSFCDCIVFSSSWVYARCAKILPYASTIFFKDWFIALRCTNVYMNFPLKLFQIPIYMRLLT